MSHDLVPYIKSLGAQVFTCDASLRTCLICYNFA